MRYEDAPSWVDRADLDPSERSSNSPVILVEQHARIEDGRLWTYRDTAISFDSPQALTQLGTLSASWLPDKGDLIVHSVELIRDGETIDLLANGAVLEVLRREKGLESRLIDGSLTATMAVPGALIGDTVRLSYSVTLKDQAMGDNVQWEAPLFAKPFPMETGQISIAWPQDVSVSRVHIGDAEVAEPVAQGGFQVWSAQLPVKKQDEMPSYSPMRYHMDDILQVSTYEYWSGVSRNTARHYDPAATIAPDGDLARRIAAIAAASESPLEHTASALRLVQDDVSYLMNGLNGGNYLPQSPEETWEKRFGDCKAKSLLLLAMLSELGITSEVVLVRTQGGDVLPMLAPMPGNFDHMIVRAEIDGRSYWLDGTSAGTRIDTIDEVPRFFYALPLRTGGADLMPLDTRMQSIPDRTVRMTIDQGAGIRLPALFDIELEFRGVMGAQWREVAQLAEDDAIDDAVSEAVTSVIGGAALIDRSIDYDEDAGIATLRARGVQTTAWKREGSDYTLEMPGQAAKEVGFDADRARANWRDIPLRLNGPIYYQSGIAIRPPQDGGAYELRGSTDFERTIGGVELASAASLEDDRFTLVQRMRSLAEELPADRIAQAKRSLVRFDRALLVDRVSGDVRELWEYLGEDRALLGSLERFYAKNILQAKSDDPTAYLNRAWFGAGVFDHAGALKDAALLAEPGLAAARLMRGIIRIAGGDAEGREDVELALAMQPALREPYEVWKFKF